MPVGRAKYRSFEAESYFIFYWFTPYFCSVRFTDQIGHEIELSKPVTRVISTVPSQTELLYDLGVRPAAQSLFCVHPKEAFSSAMKIGGTKKLKLEKIASLEPDLIIANKEENEKEQIQWLQERFPVWTSDVLNLEDALDMIRQVGYMLNTPMAEGMVQDIQKAFENLRGLPSIGSALYLIWQEPFMAVGKETFIHHMLQSMGLSNALNSKDQRYPILTVEQMKQMDPDFILLSSEPFPFKAKHKEALQKQLPGCRIELVNGEYCSWYGSRLLKAVDYFRSFRSQLGPGAVGPASS